MDIALFILACALPGLLLGGTRFGLLGFFAGGAFAVGLTWFANRDTTGVAGLWAGNLVGWWTALIATLLGRTIRGAIRSAKKPPSYDEPIE